MIIPTQIAMSKTNPVLIENLTKDLTFLYGNEAGKTTCEKLILLIAAAKRNMSSSIGKTSPINKQLWDEKDIALITYADAFQEPQVKTLKSLHKFLLSYVKDRFNIIHILPFYPFTSDRGFSVSDYLKVKREFGSWVDIKKISNKYMPMMDFVVNHCSTQNKWFKEFLQGNKKYEDYFIWFKKDDVPWDDIGKVIRTRTTPLLTPFSTKTGEKYVWTTYSVGNSTDQVDLNYHNPKVLLDMVKVILFLMTNKSHIFRFDAIAGLWKELGTSCRHLPQTHALIRVFRTIIEEVNPSTLVLCELLLATYEENTAYFGNGENEAHMVYNFPLPMLVMHAFYSGSSVQITKWLTTFKKLSAKTTYFNTLDTHDGTSVRSAYGILTDEEIKLVIDTVIKNGGSLSYRTIPKTQEKTVKDLHITWWSALNGNIDEPFDLQVKKFITSRAIQLALKGIPAIYYLSLFGAKNDVEAFNKTQHGRDINRTNFDYQNLSQTLNKKENRESIIFASLMELIEKRKRLSAFHPSAAQEMLQLNPRVFSILRGEGKARVLALHNVCNKRVEIVFEEKTYVLEPYSYLWQRI